MRFPMSPLCLTVGTLLGVVGLAAPPGASGLLLTACGLCMGVLYQHNRQLRDAREPEQAAVPTHTADDTERRAAPRIQPDRDELHAAVLLDGAWIPASVIDISTRGIRLCLNTETPLPDVLPLTVHLHGQNWPARGQIRWKERCAERTMLGLSLIHEEGSATAEAIGDWARARVARSLPPVRLAG